VISGRRNVALISDFNTRNLAAYLTNDSTPPVLAVDVAPFGQVESLLLDAQHALWRTHRDVVVVWTRPEGVIAPFARLVNGEPVDSNVAVEAVDRFCLALEALAERATHAFVPLWTLPPEYATGSMLDLQPSVGVSRTLSEMNSRLLEKLDALANVHPLDTQRWIVQAGPRAYSPKLWYMAKIPFGNDVFLSAAADLKSGLNGLLGTSAKLIVVDLDDTLWGGVIGEAGWKNIRLGGHDAEGEAYVDFQRALKALQRRGILLAIVSKNDETTALEGLRNHPEMVLRETDFSSWRINWGDKAQNIVEVASELNLGLQSIVFLDDNPVERARVRETLPDVIVPDLPADPMLLRRTLMSMPYFNVPRLTMEDLDRTRMYRAEKDRASLFAGTDSIDEWLKTLETHVRVEELDATNISRVAQLLNKTNQMNLTTRRLTESELIAWADEPSNRLWAFRTIDKFGDSGLTGIASLATANKEARLVDFVLSCRVMGRKIEDTMLFTVLRHATRAKVRSVTATFIPTARNKPCLDFFESTGARKNGSENVFVWDTRESYPLPDSVTLDEPPP
jgi:FkbH-like protein